MSEPVMQVSQDQILAMLGAKEVENQLLRMRVSQLEKKVTELEDLPKTECNWYDQQWN